jgi:hypothetical protein
MNGFASVNTCGPQEPITIVVYASDKSDRCSKCGRHKREHEVAMPDLLLCRIMPLTFEPQP